MWKQKGLSTWPAIWIAAGAVGCHAVEPSDEEHDRKGELADYETSGHGEAKSLTDTVWPISGSATPQSSDDITDSWGPRLLSGNYDFHRGIDIAEPEETPVYAIRDGTIVRMEYPSPGHALERFGRFMVIAHADVNGKENQTAYLHLFKYEDGLAEEDTVVAGQKIGEVGSTGVGINTAHLHFEYYEDVNSGSIVKAKARSPMKILQPATGSLVPTVTVTKTSTEIIVEVEQEDDKIVVGQIFISPTGASADRTIDLQTGTGLHPTDWDIDTYDDVTIDPDNFNQSSTSQVIRYRYAGSWSSLASCLVKLYDVSGTELYNDTTTF